MTTDKSLENCRIEADERAVRRFLENAAPIILESRVLEDERFEAVVELADEQGLSRDQLACELRLLEQRGVITSAPWGRLDGDELEARGKQHDGTASASPAASPTPSDSPPSEPADWAAARRPVHRPASTPQAVPRKSAPESRRVPPAPPAPAPVRPDTAASTPIEALRFRAQKLLAKHGTLSARMRKKLQAAGRQVGLAQHDIDTVLNALDPPERGSAPPVAAAPPAREASRPPAPSPSESFRRWIQQKLSGYPSSILNADDEHGLIGVGVHRYHLAEVLATHIVREVATEREMRLERDLDGASCHSTVGTTSGQASSDDQKLKEFFEQVAPILSQHRGINAKSRVMLNAVAERLGLSEEELERALLALQRLAADPNESDPRQLERRESFRSYLRRAMAQLPDGIITFKTETRLIEAGEHFHGVTPQWIKPTINEVAAEIGARFISKQQALDHIRELVTDVLGDKPVIDSATRARIYTEGTRWGLDPMDVDSILRDKSESLRRQAARERRRARWIMNLSVTGLLLALSVIGWILLPKDVLHAPPPVSEPAAIVEKKPESRPASHQSWWDEETRMAIANLRVIRPDLREALEKLDSDQVNQRTESYRQLVSQFTHTLPNSKRQQEMQQLLSRLYTLEPDDSAAAALATAVTDQMGQPDSPLPKEPAAVRAMFWGCRAAVDLLKAASLPAERGTKLAQRIETSVSIEPDRLLATEALQQQCSGALARRLYRQFTRSAADDPALIGQLYGQLALEAEGCLDTATLNRLDVDFLATILPAANDTWDRYADVIRRVALAADPTTVIKMLDIYRHASDSRLKSYVAGQFLDRLEAPSGTLTEQEMIEELRKSLGVVAQEDNRRHWRQVGTRADELLGRKHVSNTHPDVVLQETIELAHAATLVCSLVQGDAGAAQFDELQTRGPVKLDIRGGPWSPPTAKKFDSSYPVTSRTVLRNNIHSLSTSRLPTQRIQLLRLIANQTSTVPDLDLPAGQTLAKYLVQFKPDEQEHQQILSVVPRLATWNAVRLGLSDQLLEVPGRDTQLQQLFAAILEGNVDVGSPEGRAKIRRRLLSEVAAKLASTPETDDPRLRVFDEGSQALRDLYATQAKLLGVPADSYSSARQPSEVLLTMVRHLAEQLGRTKLAAADKALLDGLPYRLTAIDFAAQTDLQYTVALHRIWLRLLALQVSQQHPETATAIRNVLAESEQPAPDEETVFEQMRDVQALVLRVWMQLRPAADATKPEDVDE